MLDVSEKIVSPFFSVTFTDSQKNCGYTNCLSLAMIKQYFNSIFIHSGSSRLNCRNHIYIFDWVLFPSILQRKA